jgi:nucleotide-binding universal stress UspA family protein
MKIESILVPVDLSEASKAAMHRGLALARAWGARSHWLHVVVTPPAPALYPAFSMPAELGQYTESLRAAHEEGFARALAELDLPLDAIRQVVIGTSAATEIVHYAKEHAIDLIVMGTHGHSGFRRLLLGSVAEGVVRRAERAVMTVPPSAAPENVLHHVVAAVDFSDLSPAVVATARELAGESGCPLSVVHAVAMPSLPLFDLGDMAGSMIDPTALIESARVALSSLCESSDGPAIEAKQVILEGSPEHEIGRYVEEHGADLVVAGSHGHGGLERALLGSVVERLLRRVDCPVLVVRADKA